MAIIDGKKLAVAMEGELRTAFLASTNPLTLAILTGAPNPATRSYLALKEQRAAAFGVKVILEVLPETATTADYLLAVQKMTTQANGIVVQLPLPAKIDTELVLSSMPASHDVDNFRYTGAALEVLPPVVGAIDLISQQSELSWEQKKVVVFGSGRLVGAPSAVYAKTRGASVTIIRGETDSVLRQQATAEADIIILGVGKPKILQADMVKTGVVVFDAGTSEADGVLVGDADPKVAAKSILFTPVPGGIGPLTVVLLFRNLLDLALRQ